MKSTEPKKCLGFGEFKGKCENPAGCPHTPYWCVRCNQLRFDYIDKQLAAIRESVRKYE